MFTLKGLFTAGFYREFLKLLLFKISITAKILLFVFVLGLFIRLLGTNPGYPQIHPDEPSIQEATRILVVFFNYDPQNYYYGSLLSIMYAIVMVVVFIPTFFVLLLIKDFHVVFERGPLFFIDYFTYKVIDGGPYFDTFYNFFPYYTRYQTAILSSFGVVITYFLAKKLFNKEVGLIAAFFVAINYRHVLSSTLTLADAPAAVFALLSVFLSVNILEKGSLRRYLFAGLGIGLSLSVKYFVYIIPAFFICHIISSWRVTQGTVVKKATSILFSKKLVLAIVVAAFLFLVINPYVFFKEEAHRQLQYNALRYGLDFDSIKSDFTFPFDTLISDNWQHPFVYLYRYGIGEFLSVFVVIGFLYSLVKYFRATFILSSVFIPFLFIFVFLSGNTPVRNYSSIIPFLLVFPSVIIYALFRWVKNLKVRNICVVLLTVGLGFSSLKNSFLSSYYSSQQLNYTSSFIWMNEYLEENATIVKTSGAYVQKEHVGVQMDPMNDSVDTVGMSLFEAKAKGADYIIIDSGSTTLANVTSLTPYEVKLGESPFNEGEKWELLDNMYVSLAVRELGKYRIAQFTKPYWQSLEPAIFIVKVPAFWQLRKDKEVIVYDFEEDVDNFKITSRNDGVFQSSVSRLISDAGLGVLSVQSCQVQMQIQFPRVSVMPGKWYSATARASRLVKQGYERSGAGFLRLDFYSDDDLLLSTHVSKLLPGRDGWHELGLAGLSPENVSYARLSFQFNNCFAGEKYYIDDITLYESDEVSPTDYKEYPFYKDPLPRNFIWLPEIM